MDINTVDVREIGFTHEVYIMLPENPANFLVESGRIHPLEENYGSEWISKLNSLSAFCIT